MAKLVGKVKTFSFNTGRFCKECGKKVVSVSGSNKYRCPECGLLDWTKTDRLWFAILNMDVIDIDVRVFFLNKTLPLLTARMGISWQMLKDQLKDLRGEAWLEKYKEIKNEIEAKANQHLIGRIMTVHGHMGENNAFLVKRIGEATNPKMQSERTHFVEGKLEELNEVTEKVLDDYKRDVELWEETPVIRFTKSIEGVEIEIGIRAPLTEYAKSYRVWMRFNGVHMYPAEPVRVGKSELGKDYYAWVYRVYHSKGWRQKLEHILEYCTELENQGLTVVNAAKKLDVKQIEEALQGLPTEITEEIKQNWSGGNVWDLAKTASKIDRAAGIHVLRKFGLLGTSDIVKGSNAEKTSSD